jgi:hypothetical protein
MEAGEEVDGAAVVACGDVAKMLEFVEEALDPIAQRARTPLLPGCGKDGRAGGCSHRARGEQQGGSERNCLRGSP